MSGIVVLIRIDGGPIQAGLIENLTASMAARGPDGRSTRDLGDAALGHTRLGTVAGSPADPQPLTLDGNTWIVADARIDDRQTLMRGLELNGQPSDGMPSDAELILRAFLKWGDRCVDHLLGDFAFAIWAIHPSRFFCARDQLGIKPLHYVRLGTWLAVSSDVECLRRHPEVSDTLDDVAVSDFLLFGHKADPAATTFRDIRKVPPAHALTWTRDAGCSLRRYWEFPIEEPLYRRDREYVDELRELLDLAVSDRLRTDRVGIFLSGGLDSAILAATAVQRIASSAPDPIHGFLFAYRSLIDDEEPAYARAAAAHLEIPLKEYIVDEGRGWDGDLELEIPEPHLVTPGGAAKQCHADMALHSSVALSGEGPDNALQYEWRAYLTYLRRTRRWGRMAADAASFIRHQRRLPRLTAVMTPWPATDLAAGASYIPSWMSPALIQRCQLEERWRYVMRQAESAHPIRPVAYFSLTLPLWQTMFDSTDPSYTRVPLEVRHPFLDVRVLRYLMRVPVIPWCRDKYLLRYAFQRDLPHAVLHRSKTPLQGEPAQRKMSRDGVPEISRSNRLDMYAVGKPSTAADQSPAAADAALRLAVLSRWLCRLDSARTPAASR